jgi:hypothetical protein
MSRLAGSRGGTVQRGVSSGEAGSGLRLVGGPVPSWGVSAGGAGSGLRFAACCWANAGGGGRLDVVVVVV